MREIMGEWAEMLRLSNRKKMRVRVRVIDRE